MFADVCTKRTLILLTATGCCLLLLTPLAECYYERLCTVEDRMRPPQGVCGKRLSNMVSMVCKSRFNKRAITAADHQTDGDDIYGSLPEGSLFMPKSAALSYLTSKRTAYNFDGTSDDGRRGLSCECCIYQCNWHELAEYCAQPAGQVKRMAVAAAGGSHDGAIDY